ncbi:MAG: DoxX family membrane protein [Armatimonadetes bacterium]|nr:DoxX family membrane protein [Armatimonadota bacterium]
MPVEKRYVSRWWAVPLRLYMAAVWLNGGIEKLNPSFGGIRGIVRVMAEGDAAHPGGNPIEPFRRFLLDIVLPNWQVFGALITLSELFVGIMLLLGVLTRLGALIGIFLFITYWMGRGYLEWAFVYPALIAAQIAIIWTRAGRTLGLDARLWRMRPRWPLW